MGNLPMNYALWIGACSCIGILFCLMTMTRVIQRTGRPSIVVLVLTVIMAASAAMVPIFSYPNLINMYERGINIWAFNDPCA